MKSGLIAKDIHRSVLPDTFRAFCKDVAIECSFEIFNVPEESFADTVKSAGLTLDGFVVTMPYKRKILDFTDSMDESAEQCGSCNIVKVCDNKLVAYNTDGWGFIKALSLKGIDVKGMRVVMVGAGGVAMSLAYNLKKAGVARIDVVNLYTQETEQLCERFGEIIHPYILNQQTLKDCAKGADLFLNASILGQIGYSDYEDTSFLDGLARDAIVFDVNYSNPAANLPLAAAERGLRAYIGCCMSACQGIRAMEIWTGLTPSDACARSLVEKLERRGGQL